MAFVDLDKCRKCFDIGRSWFGRPHDAVVERVDKDEDFRREWEAAEKVYDVLKGGGDPDWPYDASLLQTSSFGSRTESTLFGSWP